MADDYSDYLDERGDGQTATASDDSYEEYRRQKRQDDLAAERARRTATSKKAGPPLAADARPVVEPGTATVSVGPVMPVETGRGRRTAKLGLEALTPVASAVPDEPGHQPGMFDRVMRSVGGALRDYAPHEEDWNAQPGDDYVTGDARAKMRRIAGVVGGAMRAVGSEAERFGEAPVREVERAATLPFRAAATATDLAGRGVGTVGDMGIGLAREHPAETALLSNPYTAPATMVAQGVESAAKTGAMLKAKLTNQSYGEPDQNGVGRVPTWGDIGMEALPIAFAGLEAGPLARQINTGGSVVDRVLSRRTKVAAEDFATNKRFASALDRQAREKVALPLLQQEKDAAELASAQRDSRRRRPLALPPASSIEMPAASAPPGPEAPGDVITRTLQKLQRDRGFTFNADQMPAAQPASSAEVESYRRVRDAGEPIPSDEETRALGFRTRPSLPEIETRIRSVESLPVSGATASDDVGDFFSSRAAGRTTARDDAGLLKRDLSKVEIADLEDEHRRILGDLGNAEGSVAHREDPRWLDVQQLPTAEQSGVRRVTDVERAAGARAKRRMVEDLPTGDDAYDPDELAALRAQDSEYQKGTMARQAKQKAADRIAAEIKRRGSADPDLILPGGGAVAGGVAGSMVGDTPEDRQRNALIGAAAGGGLGALTARVLGESAGVGAADAAGGNRGGYVGEPKYMLGSRPFPKPIPPEMLARQAEIEKSIAARIRGKPDLKPAFDAAKKATESPVLKGEEQLTATGEGATVLSGERRVAEPSVDDLQKMADERGIKVRAAGMSSKETLPSDPAVNLGMLDDDGLKRMTQAAAEAGDNLHIRRDYKALAEEYERRFGEAPTQPKEAMALRATREATQASKDAERGRGLIEQGYTATKNESGVWKFTNPQGEYHGGSWIGDTPEEALGRSARSRDADVSRRADAERIRGGNRTGAVGDIEKVGGAKSPMMRDGERSVKLAKDEREYFDSILANPANARELVEEVPSLRREGDHLVFDEAHADALDNWVGHTNSLEAKRFGGQGAASYPKSFAAGGRKFGKRLLDARLYGEAGAAKTASLTADELNGLSDEATTAEHTPESVRSAAEAIPLGTNDSAQVRELLDMTAHNMELEAKQGQPHNWRETLAGFEENDAARDMSFKPEHYDEVRRVLGGNSGNRTGAIAPELLAAAGGAGAGSLAIDQDDTTAEKIAKVVGGGLVGVAGVKGAKAAGRRSIVAEGGKIAEGSAADVAERAARPRLTKAELFNKSLQVLDPEGRELWKNEEARLIQGGEKKRVVTDADIRKLATTADVDQITKQDASRLNTTELFALGNRIKEDREVYASLMERMEKEGGTLSAEETGKIQGDMDTVLARLLSYDKQLNRAGSETGRALRILGRIAARKGTVESALQVARRATGVKELGDDITKRLAGVMNNPNLSVKERQQMIAKIVGEYVDKGPVAAAMDIRRWGMLSAPATHAVNLLGNVAEAASNLVITPVAAAIDRMVSAATGGERTIGLAGRGEGYASGLVTAAKKIDKSHFEGINPEDPLNTLNLQRANYIKSFGLDKEGAWRAALRPAARILQRSGDIVYGVMGVADAPFYQAQLKSSLMERAGLRAEREGLKAGSPEFKQKVIEYMKPENVSEVDATMASIEAMDATFKSPTGISAAMRLLEQKAPIAGAVARWVVPFPNTPTNLVRKALEATPGIGQMLTEVQARALKKQLQSLGATKEEIAREVQRKRITGAAKQLTTGAGLVGLGYYWTKAGMLSGDYVQPLGRDQEERDEAGLRRLTGQGPLTLKVGDTAHSLAGFAQFAPLLALGHALAQEDEAATRDPRNAVPLPEKMANAGGAAVKSTIRTFANFPLLQGAENLSKITEGVGKYAGKEAASMIPFSSAVAVAARAMDTEAKRPPETGTEAFKERLPGARESIPSSVTPLGKVQERPGVAATLFAPTRPQKVIQGPVEDELTKLKVFPGMPKKLPLESRGTYASRVKAEGGELHDVLGRLIASPDYAQWPPPEWVQQAVEHNEIWTDQKDKRTPQEKAKVALLEYMTRFVRSEQTKRRKGAQAGAAP